MPRKWKKSTQETASAYKLFTKFAVGIFYLYFHINALFNSDKSWVDEDSNNFNILMRILRSHSEL